MKCILSLATVLMLAASASAADMGSLGLPGFKPMSNSQAMNVRGKFAVAGGVSYAATATSGSINGALAFGHHSAFAANVSIATSGGFITAAGGAAFAAGH
jgi:hypothetical protein